MPLKPDESNPYASPETEATLSWPEAYDSTDRKLIAAIIADANGFWLAILVCMLCGGIGSMIMAPWYLARYLQWQRMAATHPELLIPGAPRHSTARRFQSAKVKLFIGMGAAVVLLLASIAIAILELSR